MCVWSVCLSVRPYDPNNNNIEVTEDNLSVYLNISRVLMDRQPFLGIDKQIVTKEKYTVVKNKSREENK